MHTKQPKKKKHRTMRTKHCEEAHLLKLYWIHKGMTPTQADLLHLEALLHCSGALPDEVRLKDEHYFMSIGQINVFT